MARRLAIGLAFVAAAFTTGVAQQPPLSPSTFQARVDVVQVDVSVLDRSRRPVRGLQAADFSIKEDGVARKIVAFSEIDLPAASSPSSVAWAATSPSGIASNTRTTDGRLVTILLDASIDVGAPTITARRIATTAVEQLSPGDLAAVVFGSAFAKNGTPQTFTSDRARLLSAINSPFLGQTYEPTMGPGGLVAGDPHDKDDTCWCGTCLLKTITRVAASMSDIPQRRKSLILIGSGVGISIGPPQEFRAELNCSEYVRDARENMLATLAAANVTIHAFDPTGLETNLQFGRNGLPRGRELATHDRLESQGVLTELAERTGGRATLNTNDPAASVAAAFRETGSYYVLGFERGAVATPFHKIDVKVNRKGLDVRTRRGYDDRSPASAAKTTPPDRLETLIARSLPHEELALQAAAEPFDSPAGPVVAVAVGLKRPLNPGSTALPIQVLMAAVTADGAVRGGQRQTIEIPPSATGRPQEEESALMARLPVKPGRYELRVGVLPGDAPGGSVYVDVDVPDFGKVPLSLSGIVVGVQPGVPSEPANTLADLIPITPTTRRVFGAADRALALVRTYQGGGAPLRAVEMTARFIGANGAIVAAQSIALDPGQFNATRSVDQLLDLQTSKLRPGRYLLSIDASAGVNSAHRDVQFEVR